MRSRTTARSRAARLAASFLLLACITGPVVACGSGDGSVGPLVGPGCAFGAGGTEGNIVPALVGSWFRLVYLPDSAGSVRTLESTLAFNSDGTLTRTLVTRTLSFGFLEHS